jgi:hypothetical protein
MISDFRLQILAAEGEDWRRATNMGLQTGDPSRLFPRSEYFPFNIPPHSSSIAHFLFYYRTLLNLKSAI